MKRILVILTLISSLISLSYAKAQGTLPSVSFEDMKRAEQGKVKDIIGPQTLLLESGQIIYLVGIEIPNSYGEDISPLAVTARDILKDLLDGQRVQLYKTKHKELGLTNRMGHDLVHLERLDDNAWAQGTLLALGLARVKTTARNSHMAGDMLLLEEKARSDKLGIWGDITVLTPDTADSASGSFAIVEGQVESVALKKNRIYINFGKDWKTDFTLSIAPDNKRAFAKEKLDPQSWGGQTIRVRGNVRDYNGPYMEIDHPAAVEFIK